MRYLFRNSIKNYRSIIASLLILVFSTHSSAQCFGCCYQTSFDPSNERTPLVGGGGGNSILSWMHSCLELDQPCCPDNGAPRYVILAIIAAITVGAAIATTLIYFLSPSDNSPDNNSTSLEKYTRSSFIINDTKDLQVQCQNGEPSVGVVQTANIEPNYQAILSRSARNQLDSTVTDDTPEFTDSFLQLNQALCEGYYEPEALNDCSARILAGLRDMKPEDVVSLVDYIHVLIYQLQNKAVLPHSAPAFVTSELGLEDGRNGYISVSGHICPSVKE